MTTKEPKDKATTGGEKTSRHRDKVAQARAAAQRARLDAQATTPTPADKGATEAAALKKARGKREQHHLTNRRTNITIARAIEDYLLDHEEGNHRPKTLEWHRLALGLMQTFLVEEY